MAIEILSFPIYSMVVFPFAMLVYQRVMMLTDLEYFHDMKGYQCLEPRLQQLFGLQHTAQQRPPCTSSDQEISSRAGCFLMGSTVIVHPLVASNGQ